MERATLVPTKFQNAKELIELYLTDEGDRFAKGYYYDGDGNAHELIACIHQGMLVDTCLIHCASDDLMLRFVCRYYIAPDEVMFYNTLYGQQDYSLPILIHNNSAEPMTITLEWSPDSWTIPSWGEETITPRK